MLAVAVCIGGGDVNEGLEVVHPLGQAEELLGGDHVQLQSVSAGERRDGVRGGRVGRERRGCAGRRACVGSKVCMCASDCAGVFKNISGGRLGTI